MFEFANVSTVKMNIFCIVFSHIKMYKCGKIGKNAVCFGEKM